MLWTLPVHTAGVEGPACSAADHSAVVLGYDDQRRARTAARFAVGPRAVLLRVCGIVDAAGCLTWVLDADEHRLFVRRQEDAGDFADVRSDQEAPCLLGDGIRAQHLVVAESGVRARVEGAAGNVRLNPQAA